MFVVHTTLRLDPAQRDLAMDLISDLVEHSKAEDGTVRYRALEDLTERHTVGFFEQYEDAAAAEAHTRAEPYRRFVEALPDLVEEEIETVQFEADDVDVARFDASAAVEALD